MPLFMDHGCEPKTDARGNDQKVIEQINYLDEDKVVIESTIYKNLKKQPK